MPRERVTIGSQLEPIQPVLFSFPETFSAAKDRKPPQPHKQPVPVMTERTVKEYLNLKQKGILKDWLGQLHFNYEEILSPRELEVIDVYLHPQGNGRWLTQKEMGHRLGIPKGNVDIVRKIVLSGLSKVLRRDVYGEEALEVLGLPHFQYKRLVEAGVCTFDDFTRLNSKIIKQICPQKEDLIKFQEAFESRGFYWNPSGDYEVNA